jgi:hypothetical protein
MQVWTKEGKLSDLIRLSEINFTDIVGDVSITLYGMLVPKCDSIRVDGLFFLSGSSFSFSRRVIGRISGAISANKCEATDWFDPNSVP